MILEIKVLLQLERDTVSWPADLILGDFVAPVLDLSSLGGHLLLLLFFVLIHVLELLLLVGTLKGEVRGR